MLTDASSDKGPENIRRLRHQFLRSDVLRPTTKELPQFVEAQEQVDEALGAYPRDLNFDATNIARRNALGDID
jgi:hypothetical protein